MRMVVYFLFVYSFNDHCHRVETQMQSINILSYHNIYLEFFIKSFFHFPPVLLRVLRTESFLNSPQKHVDGLSYVNLAVAADEGLHIIT